MALFEQAGLLQQRGNMQIFKDEEARSFANGGWLEAHVFEALQSLRPQHDALPAATASGRSVTSRITSTGLPRLGASS